MRRVRRRLGRRRLSLARNSKFFVSDRPSVVHTASWLPSRNPFEFGGRNGHTGWWTGDTTDERHYNVMENQMRILSQLKAVLLQCSSCREREYE